MRFGGERDGAGTEAPGGGTRSPPDPAGATPGAGGGSTGESPILLRTLLALAGVYGVLRYVLPWIPVWTGSRGAPAPTPVFALTTYMICAILGALVYASSDPERWRAFLAPLVRLLVLEPGPWWGARLAVLCAAPVVAGLLAWSWMIPGYEPPPAVRLQHPTIPAHFAGRENPLTERSDAERGEAEREGVVLYQKNCRPCHGTRADGEGPLARGLRLRPVDFTDPGTLASLREQYPFWRTSEGAPGLPDVATPWHSAMPPWGAELTPEEIWRIVMAEYRIAEREPRRPENAGRGGPAPGDPKGGGR